MSTQDLGLALKVALQDTHPNTRRRGPPDRLCPHRQRITYVEWVEGIAELTARLPKGVSIFSTVYYAYPFRGLCPDCQYVVFSRGPEALKNT